MMMHDAGIEAKEAAVREVAKLLPLPDSLASVNGIRSDYALRQQVLWFFWQCASACGNRMLRTRLS
jgi:hypothetical protein